MGLKIGMQLYDGHILKNSDIFTFGIKNEFNPSWAFLSFQAKSFYIMPRFVASISSNALQQFYIINHFLDCLTCFIF